jgi:ATP-dependent helicase/nuclease subunit B
MGFALSTSSIFGLIDLWLSTQLELLQKETVSYQNVEAFLTHPLSGLSHKMRDKIQTALLDENYVEIEHVRLLRQSGLFEVFFRKILNSEQVVSTLINVLTVVLTRLSTAKTLKKIDAELFVKTIQELNRLHDTFGKHVGIEETSFVIYLVQKALKAIAVPLSGDPLNGIQVMGLLETRNLNFDNVVILGFNEGIIPKSSIGNSFIPDSLRRVYGLPVLENLDAISSYMVYRLIQRAKNISLVYNNLTDESTSGEASRILKQLSYESTFTFNYHELNLNVKTEVSREVKIEKKDNKFIQDTLALYLEGKRKFSPSALTQYISNPIDFFFNYIAGIKEPKEVSAVVEANEIGSILHQVMEYFYSDLKGSEVTEEAIKVRRKNVPSLIQRAFAAVMFKSPEKVIEYKGMQKVILSIVDAYVDIILSQDEAQTPFQIISLEQKVEADLSFNIHGEPATVKLIGFIDRVDLKDGITKIIDYKTGSDKLTFKDVPELFNTNGKNINKALVQTLLYTYAYEQFSGKSCVEPNLYIVKTMTQDGVWFKTGRQTLNGDFLEEIKPEFLNELRRKLTELFESTYFEVSEVEDNYKYSIYKTLFGK